ncbi:hypothetical protein [Intestinibacter bartlettii]|uniref:Uncharacterized protein n=1 Tax=Intestinibacter bartlettii CAG:1329 TaxID=1263063 RepID=R5XE51_9FIRM|nr:hypothetical protein [Intestinibacter bartlettii]CDA10669.1 uncharacterized protein BN488_01708 [Intestinibacter bartlettii CAG:1329]
MRIGKNGLEYTKEEFFSISNKAENKLKKHRSKGKCMYNSCNNNSIDSHTIPKEESLNSIAVNRKVGHFISKRNAFNKEIQYKESDINNVTTFKGFCSKHDNELFKCIDNNPNIKTGKEILLQAYRSICKSVFDEASYKVIEVPQFSEIHPLSMYHVFKDILDSASNEYSKNLSRIHKVLLKYKDSLENDIKNNFANISIEKINSSETQIIKTSDKNITILYHWFNWRIPVSLFNYHAFGFDGSLSGILNFTYIPYQNSSEAFWIFLDKDFHIFDKPWKWFISKKINTLNVIESSMMTSEFWCISPKVIETLPETRKNIFFKDMFFINERNGLFAEYDMSIFDDIRKELIKSNMCNIEKESQKFNAPIRESDEIRKKRFDEALALNFFHSH